MSRRCLFVLGKFMCVCLRARSERASEQWQQRDKNIISDLWENASALHKEVDELAMKRRFNHEKRLGAGGSTNGVASWHFI